MAWSLKLVCIGNSIVKGFPWSSGKSFPGRLRTISGWDVINKGIEGDISSNILARFSRDVIDKKPDIAIVLTGTNDYLMISPAQSGNRHIREAQCR